MAASSGFMIAEAERRFPVRIRVGVPPDGLGSRLDRIKVWLDENCGASGWAIAPSGTRGVLNDAVSIYFGDPTIASAIVARLRAITSQVVPSDLPYRNPEHRELYLSGLRLAAGEAT